MHLALVALGYVVTAWTGLTAPQFPAHDNALYQLPTFLYYANALADGFGLPRWYPLVGGTPVIVSSPSLFPFLPHKWVGYALFALTDASPLRVYQLGLLSGVLLVLAGVWHLVRELTGSREAATVAAFAVGASGAGATVWHQEQLLATITWYPWIALCAAKAARDARWLPLAAALFGITLGTHYPTIHLLTATAAVACVAALHRRAFVAWLRAVPRAVWMGAAAAHITRGRHCRDLGELSSSCASSTCVSGGDGTRPAAGPRHWRYEGHARVCWSRLPDPEPGLARQKRARREGRLLQRAAGWSQLGPGRMQAGLSGARRTGRQKISGPARGAGRHQKGQGCSLEVQTFVWDGRTNTIVFCYIRVSNSRREPAPHTIRLWHRYG